MVDCPRTLILLLLTVSIESEFTSAVRQNGQPFAIDGASCDAREDSRTKQMAMHAGVLDEYTVRGITSDRANGVHDSWLTSAHDLCKRTVRVNM